MTNFGERLKTLRKNAGMTQETLAKNIGVTKSVISYYELCERSPSPEVLIKLASIFKITTDSLLGIEKSEENFVSIDLEGLNSADIDFLQKTATYLRSKNKLNTR